MHRQFVYILAVIAFAPYQASAEQLLTATCGSLTGTKNFLVNGKTKTVPESHSGSPVFFVDSENPKKLVSLWKLKLFDKETTDKYEATIIEFSGDKLQAVEYDSNGLISYTIFLETGTLLYSHHRTHSLFDKEPTLLSFVGKCEIKVGR